MVFGLKVAILIIMIYIIFILYFCIIKTSVMPYNYVISEKCEYYRQYILNNNIHHILFDTCMPNKYSLDVYLNIYFLFQKTGISMDMLYELFDYASHIGSGNYPKRTSLHTFKNKISKIEIHGAIHHEYINKNNIITFDCLIDSVIIPNKNNTSCIGTYITSLIKNRTFASLYSLYIHTYI